MKKYMLLLLLTLGVTRVFAQQNPLQSGIVKTDSNGFTYTSFANDPAAVRIYRLKNGLQVWLSVNKTTAHIRTAIAVKTGRDGDSTGLAHYLDYLMFNGTDTYGTIAYDKEKPYLDEVSDLFETYDHTTDKEQRLAIYRQIDSVSWLAAHYSIPNEYDRMMNSIDAYGIDAYTGFDKTVFVNDIPSNETQIWLQIESERFHNPVFRLFATELMAIYDEKNRHIDYITDKVEDALYKELFKNSDYRYSTLGTVNDLENPSLVKLYKYYHTYYVPNNMAIIVAGDINPDETIKWINQYFGEMQPAALPPYNPKPEESITQPETTSVLSKNDASVTVGFRFPGWSSEATTYLDVIYELLQNNITGLVDENLLKTNKMLNAKCELEKYKDYSVFTLKGEVGKDGDYEKCKTLLLAQLDSIKQGHFNQDMIGGVINNIKRQSEGNCEYDTWRVNSMIDAFINDVPWNRIINEPDSIKTITKKDIIDFANKYFTNDYDVVYTTIGNNNPDKKVELPHLTPIKPNLNVLSGFGKKIVTTPAPDLEPVFTDYKKDITVDTLKHHVPLYYVKNKTNRLFNLYYVFEMGGKNDNTINYALVYLKYAGIGKFTADQFSKRFYELGCSFDVQTGGDRVYIALEGLDENMEAATSLLEDLLNNCTADDSAVHKILSAELDSRAQVKQNKNYIKTLLQEYGMYGSPNPSNSVLSNAQIVSITSAELVKQLHTLEGYKHKVFYYGPRDIKDAKAAITEYHITPEQLSDYPAEKTFTALQPQVNKMYFVNYEMPKTDIEWIRKACNYNPKLIPVAILFNQYFSSLLYKNLCETNKLATNAKGLFTIPIRKNDPHFIINSIETQSLKLDSVILVMNNLLDSLPQSEENFENAKVTVIKQIKQDRVNGTGILFDYEKAQLLGLNYNINEDIYNKLPEIIFADIKAFFNTYYKGQHFNYCVLGDQSKLDIAKLDKYAPVTPLNLNDIFGY